MTPNQKHRLKMAAVIAAAIAGTVLVFAITDRAEPEPSTPTATVGTVVTSSTAAPPSSATNTTAVPAGGDPHHATDRDRIRVHELADAFLPAWLHAGTPEERLAALAPSTEPALAAKLAVIPLENLPARRDGRWQLAHLDPYRAVLVHDPMGTTIAVQPTGDGWRVTKVML